MLIGLPRCVEEAEPDLFNLKQAEWMLKRSQAKINKNKLNEQNTN